MSVLPLKIFVVIYVLDNKSNEEWEEISHKVINPILLRLANNVLYNIMKKISRQELWTKLENFYVTK